MNWKLWWELNLNNSSFVQHSSEGRIVKIGTTPYISVPKENIALIILLLVAASKSTHQDGHFDT